MKKDNRGGARVFQFHKGTIETCGLRDKEISDMYFNSIKVRLKLEGGLPEKP